MRLLYLGFRQLVATATDLAAAVEWASAADLPSSESSESAACQGLASASSKVNDIYGATRQAYDTVAVDYARLLEDNLAARIGDRAVLAVFAEHVRTAGSGRLLDLGCGPGLSRLKTGFGL